MTVTLAQLTSNTAQVELPVGDDKITITYYPAKITEECFSLLSSIQTMSVESIDTVFHTFNALLIDLIKSWDLYEDAEATMLFPLDIDRFSKLPIAVRMQVFTAILSDLRPESLAPQMKNSRV